jgi:hypothetical protein
LVYITNNLMSSQESSLSNLNIVYKKHKKSSDYQAALVDY